MKKILFFVLLPFLSCAQTPTWSWARGTTGNSAQGAIYGNAVATDPSGNVYTIGSFQPSPIYIGGATLNNSNSAYKPDIFVFKHDPSGNLVWAKSFQGDSSDAGTGIAVDEDYNIYITGDFASPTLTLDSKVLTNASAGTDDIFLAKLNPSGNVIWAKSYGGNKDDIGNAIVKNQNGSIYLTANFNSPTLAIGSYVVTFDSISIQSMILAKFDTAGNPIYAISLGKGCRIPVSSRNLYVDNNDDAYVVGMFDPPRTIIGSDTLYCNPNVNNSFLAKIDGVGNVLWAVSPSGANVVTNAVTADPAGNIYVTGHFSGDPMIIGSDTLLPVCCFTGYVAKYTSAGKSLWAKSTLVNNPHVGWPLGSITSDSKYGIFIGGGFANAVNGLPPLVFGSDTLLNGSPGNDAIYLAKYDSSGNSIWGMTAASTRWNAITDLVTDQYDNIYCTGFYQSVDLIFDYDTLHWPNSYQSFTPDYFVAKVGSTGIGIGNNSPSSDIIIYPNPSEGVITISGKQQIKEVQIVDLMGNEVFHLIPTSHSFRLQIESAGVYFLHCQTERGVIIRKVVVKQK